MIYERPEFKWPEDTLEIQRNCSMSELYELIHALDHGREDNIRKVGYPIDYAWQVDYNNFRYNVICEPVVAEDVDGEKYLEYVPFRVERTAKLKRSDDGEWMLVETYPLGQTSTKPKPTPREAYQSNWGAF